MTVTRSISGLRELVGGVSAIDDLPTIVGGSVVWQSRERVNLRSHLSLDGSNEAAALHTLIGGLSAGRVLVLDHRSNLGLGLRDGNPALPAVEWTGKRVDLVGEGAAKITELAIHTVPLIRATSAHKSQFAGFAIAGAEASFAGASSTRYALEVELSDDAVIAFLAISAKSRAILLDRCARVGVRNVQLTGLFGAETSAPAGANWHSGIELEACSHCTIANALVKDIGSAILQGSTGGASWGNAYSQIRGLNVFDTAVYLSSGDDCDVTDAFIEMASGKTCTVGSSAIKCRGSRHRVKGGGCLRTYSGVNLTGNGSADAFGANGHGSVCQGFVAKSCVGPAFQASIEDTFPSRDMTFDACQAHDCVTGATANGSFHHTSGIGHRWNNCKVVGHLGTSPAFNLGGSSGAEIKRPILTNIEIVWPDSGAPTIRCGQFSFVDDGLIDGLVMVNKATTGWRFTNADRCRVKGFKEINPGASATFAVEAGSTDCIVHVNEDVTLVTDAGTNTHFVWETDRVVAASATYTITAKDRTVVMTTGASNKTVNLPIASRSKDKIVTVKKAVAGDAGNVVLDGSGAETIDGAATKTTTDFMTAVCDGVGWYLVATGGIIA